MFLCVTFFSVFLLAGQVENANILFVTTFPSVSHQSIFQPMWKELSLKGHKVTVITPMPLRDHTLTNLTEIDYKQSIDGKGKMPKKSFRYLIQKPGFLQIFIKDYIVTKLFSQMHYLIFNNTEVQKIIHGNYTFDVVIAESLFPTSSAFAAKFNCPLIGITSLSAPIPTFEAIGNPTHPIYAPDHNLPIGRELTFKDRILSVLYSIYLRVHYQWVVLPREDKTVKKLFGSNLPSIADMEKNICLLLLNRNPVFHKPMPLVPSVIELGGVRSLKNAPPLNKELETFLNNSETDVVYFSLGSNFLSTLMSEETLEIIIETFSQLPYNVVWKWEDDVLPGKPTNVFIQKWMPQISLLRHPKVKLFITQGGLQSMEETINNEVPIIGIPSHSDQTMNVDTAVKYGFGIVIDFEDLSVDILKNAIKEIISNSSYKDNVKLMKRLMNDRPFNGLERAVWWIEYVIRHKGAGHLRSPLVDVPWYQCFLLDVFAMLFLIMVIILLSFYSIYQIMKALYCILKKWFTIIDKTKKNK